VNLTFTLSQTHLADLFISFIFVISVCGSDFIAIRLRPGQERNWAGTRDLSFPSIAFRQASETQKSPINGTVSPGVKCQGCEDCRSPPSSADVQSYTSTSPYVFIALCLINEVHVTTYEVLYLFPDFFYFRLILSSKLRMVLASTVVLCIVIHDHIFVFYSF
jgi:hypothetical protein